MGQNDRGMSGVVYCSHHSNLLFPGVKLGLVLVCSKRRYSQKMRVFGVKWWWINGLGGVT